MVLSVSYEKIKTRTHRLKVLENPDITCVIMSMLIPAVKWSKAFLIHDFGRECFVVQKSTVSLASQRSELLSRFQKCPSANSTMHSARCVFHNYLFQCLVNLGCVVLMHAWML